MELFIQITVFILGACIISFLKVIAQDYPNINYVRRSQCDYCHRILQWYEIIPIIGYFIVHGKCSSCKNQIDFNNPLQEFLGGIFILLVVQFGNLNYLPLFITLIILGFSDAFYGYIYPIFYLLALPTIIWHFSTVHFLTAIIIYLSLFLLNRKSLIGLGDVEVLTILALVFDLNIILRIIILACLLCIIQFLFNKKRSYRFIPYLTIATGIIYLIFLFKT
ncbi:prepilin peptidase [Companilactobacillus sp. HBUAS56275]|uniref:prepilin peptidase n=1 Tax=Companilactobacillus sp. HBUAS56275 TaxID=3109364 RepID=UPI002FEF184F